MYNIDNARESLTRSIHDYTYKYYDKKYTTFKDLFLAIENDNAVNDGSWQDWNNCEEIEAIYGVLDSRDHKLEREFINCLIRDNGQGFEKYMQILGEI